MTVIGLTGGIASGKSTAAKYLGSLGAHVIDADVLGHRAYEPGTPAHTQVIAEFGEDVRGDNNEIDRKALGGKVFGKPDALKRLTDIVWPQIRRMAEAEIAAVQGKAPDTIVVLEAAVLFEAGWEDIGDAVWLVVVDRETAVERAIARDGVERAAIEARIDSQLSNEVRKAKADVVIDNSADEAAMREALDAAWRTVT